MKTFSLLIIFFIIVSTNLTARENPFEPTQMYETEVARLMEVESDYPYEFQEKEDQEEHKTVEKEDETTKIEEKKPEEKKVEVKDTVKKVIPEVKQRPEKQVNVEIEQNPEIKPVDEMVENKVDTSMEIMTQKSITLENAMEKLDEEQIIVEVPKRTDITIHENIDILPFVNIDYTNDKIEINSKYDVFRKFTIEASNKLVLDYHAKTFFLTKMKDLDTEYFEKLVIGNHLKDKYFRIVIVLKNKPNKYKVTYLDNLVTITFDKDMI